MGKLVFVLMVVLLPVTLSFADSRGHLAGDISGASGLPDGVVDFFDLAVMAGEWASDTPQLLADIAGTAGVGQPDGVVDCIDFAVLAEEWLARYDANTPVDLVADANFSRDSIAFLDGKEYTQGTWRLATLAVSSVSDCVIHGAENVLGAGPVILAPKCSAGGYIYATETNHNNIYRSSDGCDWEQTSSNLAGVFRIFGTQSGSIIVAKAGGGNMKLYKSTVGGRDLSDQNLPAPVLILPNQGTLAASVGIWNFHQAQNGTICLSEYGTQNSFKKSRIYRSIDDGSSFTQVYDEPDFVYHSHRIMKHEATGRWVNVYGDGAPMNKVVKSDDDGLTWSTLDPQPDNHFQPVDFYDYGNPTNLLYGSDSLHFIGTFDVLTRKITPLYSDGDRYCPFVFSIFYHNGVYYAGTFSGRLDSPNRRTAILVSSDLNHWAVYHQFRNGEQGVNKFLGVWGGKIHGIVTSSDTYTWRHFSFTPATITLVEGLCLDPANVNMLNNPQDSSVETDTSHWSAGGTRTRITTDALHGTACLRIEGNSGIETVYPLSRPVTIGNTYSCRVWLKANGMNVTGRVRWYVYGTSRYGTDSYFCLSQDSWTEVVLPPVTIGAGESHITIHIKPRSSDWPGPYDFLVDAAQYEAGPPSRWQVGGEPRANETLSKSVMVRESWTEQILWAPESRSEFYSGFGNQYIKTWYKDPNNYLEFYFNPVDNTFNLQPTIAGIPQTPITTSAYSFYRNSVIRTAISCGANSLKLSIAAAAAYEHVYGSPADFLLSGTLISQTGDHSGTSMISCTLLSDVLYHSILPDDKLQ